MQITKGQKIAGQPATVLRDALRHLRDGSWESRALGRYLGTPPAQARQIALRLVRLGYLERDKDIRNQEAWSLTDAGRALTNANAMRPLPREQAELLIKEFLGRVRDINANPYFLYKVTKVILFGSFLSKKESLGDVDLAIQLSPKERNQDRFHDLLVQRSQAALNSGRRFSTFIDQMSWADTEVRRYLKGKSRYISLHSASDGILKRCAQYVLFPRSHPRRARKHS